MDFKKLGPLVFLLLNMYWVSGQVKIGANPNSIDAASIVELESDSKALVLTRVSTAQMQAISPLQGAVVYNTDTQCVYYYDGTLWTNLCDGAGQNQFSFTDNGDGTFTLTDENGNDITFNGAPETITSLVDNLDGTFTFTNESGTQTIITSDNTDSQNISTDGNPGNISIDNGDTITLNVDDADADDQNEIQVLSKSGITIALNNGGGSVDETVTSLAQDTGTGVITYTNEAATPQTASVVSTDTDNAISVGADGGAFLAPYEKIVIWAEENGGLANNQLEWSFGNGATGRIGIPLPEAWEAYAVSFNADTNGGSDSVLMAVIDSNTNTNLFTFTATGNTNNMVYTEILTTPVAIPVGTSIGFRTITETGNVTDARVAVFLRRRP